MTADNPLDQSEVTHHAWDYNPGYRQFNNVPVKTLSMGYFKLLTERNDRRTALKTLMSRTRINVDDGKFNIGSNDTMLGWENKIHHLDHVCWVPTKPSLAAILPRRGTPNLDWEWTMDMRPTNLKKQFSSKHSKLGFDPANSMLWVGQSCSYDVWMAIVTKPDDLFSEAEVEKDGKRRESTSMSVELYQIALIFMTLCFDKHGLCSITQHGENRYPSLGRGLNLGWWTNIQ